MTIKKNNCLLLTIINEKFEKILDWMDAYWSWKNYLNSKLHSF